MIERTVSKENCIRAAGEGDVEIVRKFFLEQAYQDSTSSYRDLVKGEEEVSERPEETHFPGGKSRLDEITRTVFAEAIENGQLPVVQMLFFSPVKELIQPVLQNRLQEFLMHAIHSDYVDIVICLLENGVDPNEGSITDAKDTEYNEEELPLFAAVAMGSLEIVQALVAHGANVHYASPATYDGQTVLHLAAKQDDVELIDFLILHGVDVNVQDEHNRETPLHYAAKKGNLQAIQRLIGVRGINLNALNRLGSSALYLASVNGHKEIMRLLEDAGACRDIAPPRTPRK